MALRSLSCVAHCTCSLHLRIRQSHRTAGQYAHRLAKPHSFNIQRKLHANSRKSTLHCRASAEVQGASPGLAPELRGALENFVQEHKVVLFMKGTKQFPQCGFSNTCVQIFNVLGTPFDSVNILEDESLRQGMKEFSQWPTFPQVYIDGEFYGGCDILIEAYQSGELAEVLEAALNS